jgi:Ca2+-binding RTX toxin-like protein
MERFTSAVTHPGSSSGETLTGNGSANVMVGGRGNDVMLGNGGADVLHGAQGHDVLAVSNLTFRRILGGTGFDTLRLDGSGFSLNLTTLLNTHIQGIEEIYLTADDDILIAGRTVHDAFFNSLDDIRTAWISSSSYTTRITRLRAGVGFFGLSLKAKVDVLNDAGEDDSVIGGSSTDWYFRAIDDVLTDLFAGEVVDLL